MDKDKVNELAKMIEESLSKEEAGRFKIEQDDFYVQSLSVSGLDKKTVKSVEDHNQMYMRAAEIATVAKAIEEFKEDESLKNVIATMPFGSYKKDKLETEVVKEHKYSINEHEGVKPTIRTSVSWRGAKVGKSHREELRQQIIDAVYEDKED